jgi:hypothetical protein
MLAHKSPFRSGLARINQEYLKTEPLTNPKPGHPMLTNQRIQFMTKLLRLIPRKSHATIGEDHEK